MNITWNITILEVFNILAIIMVVIMYVETRNFERSMLEAKSRLLTTMSEYDSIKHQINNLKGADVSELYNINDRVIAINKALREGSEPVKPLENFEL